MAAKPAPYARELPSELGQRLVMAARREPATLLAELGSHADGLTEFEAEAVRKRVGLNEVEHERPLAWWQHLWLAYRTPFSLLLTLLAASSYLRHDLEATVVIGSMVLLATLLRFWQERRANKAADALKAMVGTTATVMRRDVTEEAAPLFARY